MHRSSSALINAGVLAQLLLALALLALAACGAPAAPEDAGSDAPEDAGRDAFVAEPETIVPAELADEAALASLADVAGLARLGAPGHLARSSTEDRGDAPPTGIALLDGGNRDMNHFVCRSDDAERLGGDLVPFTFDGPCPEPWVRGFVIARLEGSGTMARLWMTLLSARSAAIDREILRIYVDDEREPVVQVPLAAAFDGSASEMFASPFGAEAATRLAWYYPVVFGSRIVVSIDRLGRADLYYAQLDAWIDDAPTPRTRAASRLPARDAARMALGPRMPPSGTLASETFALTAGAPVVVADLVGPGTIDALAIDVDPARLTDVRVAVRWDGATEPAIDATLAELFAAWLAPRLDAPFVLDLPMPFATRAEWTLTQTSGASTSATMRIDGRTGAIASDAGRLHLVVAETLGPTEISDHVILDVPVAARLARVCMALEGHGDGGTGILDDPFNFLEGDERFVPDGDLARAIRGTGTEDYFDSAFYFEEGPFETPFAAAWDATRDDATGTARVTACRTHRDAPIEGNSSLRATLEIGPARPDLLDRYRTATLYYAR